MKKIEVPSTTVADKGELVAEVEEDDVFQGSSLNIDDWAGGQRMYDTPCPIPGCDGKGDTLFLLNKVPFFRELILASFRCKKCGERNNEVSFGGEIQPKGCKITLKVVDPKDMNRQLIKSDSASCRFEELDFEIPPGTQKGEITTLEGLLTQAADNLNLHQAERMVQMPEIGAKVALIIMELRKMAIGDQLPFTLVLSDIAGNSFIENPMAPTPDPNMSKTDFRRSAEEDISLGLNPETAGHSDDIKSNTEDSGLNRLLEANDSAGGVKLNRAEIVETEDDRVRLGKDEVPCLPSPCPNCSKMGEMRSAFTSIPHFKEVLIMAFNCAYCGLRQSEVKAGGAIPTFGTMITLLVKSPEDLKRDVLKGEGASIEIPEMDLMLMGGTLGGVYTTIEGLLEKLYTNLRDNNPFGVGDSTRLHHSDDESTKKLEFKAFMERLKDLSEGKVYPFTVKIKDALGNSFISGPLGSHLPPESDPNLEMVDYERSEEENEDFGLLDMNTADFETGYENEDKEALVLPDRVTHVLEKNVDHPTPFAQGCPDDTPMGVYNAKDASSSGGKPEGDGDTAAEGQGEYLQPPGGYSAAKHSLGGMDDHTSWAHGAGAGAGAGVEKHWQDAIDVTAYSTRQLGDDSALKLEFSPSEEFLGPKAGKVFRLGSLGLGYYPDVRKLP